MSKNFGKFGESSAICQTKIFQISSLMNNPLADLLIHQTVFCQTPEKGKFAKHSPQQPFSLYGMRE